jgi:ferredoxin-NADP reductase
MKLKLVEKKLEVFGVESLIFEPEQPIAWKAGQFLHYVLHHEPTDDRGSDRWFTVASAPFEQKVMITTRFAEESGSSFKKTLKALKVGESIEVSDIDGDFTVEDVNAEYVFIAGGIGVTPFHAILKEFDHQNIKLKATLLYSNREAMIPYKYELDRLASSNEHLKIEYIVGGRIDDAKIREHVPDLQKPIFYVSGPEPMVNGFNELLKQMGVPEAHIKGDWFPGYTAESAHA